jgi:hypothetical protein
LGYNEAVSPTAETVAVSGLAVGYDPAAHDPIVAAALGTLFAPAAFRTGAAPGVDTVAARIALAAHPTAAHIVVRPAAPHNGAIVRAVAAAGGTVLDAPEGRTTGASYLLRNDLLLVGATVLFAFPPTATEVLRGRGGGTWSTVRRARKAGLPIHVFPLDGSAPWVEHRRTHADA